MKTLFATGRKSPQQKLYRWSVAAGGWVEDAPLLADERVEMEAQWPKLEPEAMTEAQCDAWFEERFRQKARR